MTLDTYIEMLYQKATYDFKEYLEVLHIKYISQICNDIDKGINEKLIEDYLKKRGYTMNYILGKRVMVKDFTCVFIHDESIEVWHDKTKNNKSVFIKDSFITGLPIVLSYMERI